MALIEQFEPFMVQTTLTQWAYLTLRKFG